MKKVCGKNIHRRKEAMLKNRKSVIVVIVVVAVIILGLAKMISSRAGSDSSDLATFDVKRGPLTISVNESGTIKAREQIIIKNEVEGRTSIIYLIPEGTVVKKDELLVELDASSLEDNRIDQEIRVQNTEASYINAKENFAVVENQARSDIDLAQLTLEFAKQDLKKYLEGEYPNQLQKAEAEITLAEEELTRAEETLKWSRTLYEEKYISQTELQADELYKKKKELDVELAKTNRDLLTDFTYQRNLAQLESDVNQADMARERISRKAKANIVQAQAELKAKEAEYQRQKDKLQKIEEQIKKAKIYAPADGLVIYATSARSGGFRSREEPLEEGQDVRERQELIYLPTANSSNAEVAIHESNLEKINRGLSAVVTVDALPGRRFSGVVTHISPLPDAQSMWMNPDLKVYNTEIQLKENDNALRTGMSCLAEIIIEQYRDVLYVPVQAVTRVGGEPTVYVRTQKSFEPRKVKIGLDNNKMIRIIEGLREGEVVLLTPPLKTAAVDSQTVGEEPAEIRGAVDAGANEQLKEQYRPTSAEPVTDANSAQIKDEQNQDRKRRFENMTPEEREEMRKKFESMSPEEREKLRQRRGRSRRQEN
jgi:HlyD family secretion protein